MLFKPENSADARPPAPTKTISGHKLSRCHMSPARRALLAVDIAAGKVVVDDLTRAQARALTGASVGYVHTAAELTPAQREQVECGLLSLSAIHNGSPTDAAIDRFVAKAGANRVMAALDRYTQPRFAFVAE
jgi:hypothetical protein